MRDIRVILKTECREKPHNVISQKTAATLGLAKYSKSRTSLHKYYTILDHKILAQI